MMSLHEHAYSHGRICYDILFTRVVLKRRARHSRHQSNIDARNALHTMSQHFIGTMSTAIGNTIKNRVHKKTSTARENEPNRPDHSNLILPVHALIARKSKYCPLTAHQDRTRNVATTRKFKYEPLCRGPLSIRLIEVIPGTRQEDIACRLYETSLDECAGSYGALSYVWGNNKENTPIQVNESTLEIGVNLRTALLNLRDLESPITLWVDAICINQGYSPEEIAERNEQVKIMGEIYRRASRTIIWLRDSVEGETERAFTILRELAQDARLHRDGENALSGGRLESAKDMVHLANVPSSYSHEGKVPDRFLRYIGDQTIRHVLLSDWWCRSWTFQEIILATDATVMIGPHSIAWDDLCLGGNHGIAVHIWNGVDLGVLHEDIVTRYLSLQISEILFRKGTATPANKFLELLIRCQFRGAKDPLDKIYSLLGLMDKTMNKTKALIPHSSQPTEMCLLLGIKPDYSLPVSAVYSDFAYRLILETGSLDILGACSPAATWDFLVSKGYQEAQTESPEADIILPSWVPNWSMTKRSVLPLLYDALDRPRNTHATSQSMCRLQLLENTAGKKLGTLLLEAHEVTKIVKLSDPLRQIRVSEPSGEEEPSPEKKPQPEGTLKALQGLGKIFKGLAALYKFLTIVVVPHLSSYVEWEKFACEQAPTNPRQRLSTTHGHVRRTDVLKAEDTTVAEKVEEEPDDKLAVYWQTLCTGTYPDHTEASNVAPGRGRKIAAQMYFYSWRASLKTLSDLHRWNVESQTRPIAFLGYLRKTWRQYGEFFRFLDGSYGRRLARGANGYLCLVPAAAVEGDLIVLAKGGRVPLVLRPDKQNEGDRYWKVVGEAYVQGIMDGEGWDEAKCEQLKVR